MEHLFVERISTDLPLFATTTTPRLRLIAMGPYTAELGRWILGLPQQQPVVLDLKKSDEATMPCRGHLVTFFSLLKKIGPSHHVHVRSLSVNLETEWTIMRTSSDDVTDDISHFAPYIEGLELYAEGFWGLGGETETTMRMVRRLPFLKQLNLSGNNILRQTVGHVEHFVIAVALE